VTAQDWYVRDAGSWRSVLGTVTPPPPTTSPDPEDPSDPTITAWQDAWNTQNYNTILGWYLDNAGLLNPSALQPRSTSHVGSSTNGQVIENRDIDYSGGLNRAVTINHNNVTVRNCRIRAVNDRNGIWIESGVTGTVIEHCEIDGSAQDYGTDRSDGNYGNIAITMRGSAATFRYNRMYGVRQGSNLNPDTVAEYNHIYDLHQNATGVSTSAFGHYGVGFGYAGGTTVRRNLLECGSSGALTIYSQSAGPATDAQFLQNLILGVGRGFGIRGGHSGENRADMSGIVIDFNRFHGTFGFPSALGEGTNAAVNIDKPGCTFVQNRWLGSSFDLPARCGTTQDACE